VEESSPKPNEYIVAGASFTGAHIDTGDIVLLKTDARDISHAHGLPWNCAGRMDYLAGKTVKVTLVTSYQITIEDVKVSRTWGTHSKSVRCIMQLDTPVGIVPAESELWYRAVNDNMCKNCTTEITMCKTRPYHGVALPIPE